MKKALFLLLAAMFLVFAYLQLNDASPVHWTMGYLAVAVSCGLAAFGRFPMLWLGAVTAVMGFWMLIDAGSVLHWTQGGVADLAGGWQVSDPRIDDTIEFLGLPVAFAVMLGLVFAGNKRHARAGQE